jgi:hypothetical protein
VTANVDVSGGTLSGGGEILGDVTIDAGGTFAPGDQGFVIDGLTNNYSNWPTSEALDLQGTLDIQIASAHDYGSIDVRGNVEVGGTLDVSFAFTPYVGEQFDIIDWFNGGGAFSSIDSNLPSGFYLEEINGDQLAIRVEQSQEVTTPEPGTLLLLGTGIASLLAARRKRRAH